MISFDSKVSRMLAAITLGLAPTTVAFSDQNAPAQGLRPDSHAPIGVMGDHLHSKGEFMLSYRHMGMQMEGHRVGENRVTAHQVYQRGFSVAAVSMEMDMDMLGAMYAPNDNVTLMLMAHHIESKMSMVTNPHATMDGHGEHGGDGMNTTHATSGWGDTSLTALVRGFENEKLATHWNLGLSAPTGSVSEVMHGVYQPYGMQLGSGTWDAKIGATVSSLGERLTWGAQALGIIRLESAGDSGFGRSDAFEGSLWSAWRASSPLSLSARLKYTAEGPLKGHYDGPHSHAAPPHFQPNYGGDILEALVGLNFVFREGPLQNNRIALEYGLPIYQQLNGVGMNREDSLTLGWQLSF